MAVLGVGVFDDLAHVLDETAHPAGKRSRTLGRFG